MVTKLMLPFVPGKFFFFFFVNSLIMGVVLLNVLSTVGSI